MSDAQSGIECQSLFGADGGVVQQSGLAKRIAQVAMDLGVGRRNLQAASVTGGGLLGLTQGKQGIPQIVVRFQERRVHRECLLVQRHGFTRAAQCVQAIRRIDQDLCCVRLDRECPPQALEPFSPPTAVMQSRAEIGVRFRILRQQLAGPVEGFEGIFPLAE